MLTIKDLNASKELDRKAMADIAGGMTIPPILLSLLSPTNTPKEAHLMGFADSYTGPQYNENFQSDNDTNVVIGSGQVVNYGGNTNSTYQGAYSFAYNFLDSIQGHSSVGG